MKVERTYYGENKQNGIMNAEKYYSPEATPYFTLVMIDGYFYMKTGWVDDETKKIIDKDSFSDIKYWEEWKKHYCKPMLPHPRILIAWIREFNEYCSKYHPEEFNKSLTVW